MTSGILQVLYTCEPCGSKDIRVTVRHRKDGEDIRVWMEDVQRRVGNDHAARSPHCHSTKMTDLKIPVVDNTPIGGIAKAQ